MGRRDGVPTKSCPSLTPQDPHDKTPSVILLVVTVSQAKRPKPRTPKTSPVGDAPSDNAATASGGVGRKRPRTPSWEREYQKIWKTVNELGAEQFTGKEKKAYEARKIVERGGRVSGIYFCVNSKYCNIVYCSDITFSCFCLASLLLHDFFPQTAPDSSVHWPIFEGLRDTLLRSVVGALTCVHSVLCLGILGVALQHV